MKLPRTSEHKISKIIIVAFVLTLPFGSTCDSATSMLRESPINLDPEEEEFIAAESHPADPPAPEESHAKRLRTHLINTKNATIAAFEEECAYLKTEVGLIQDINDEQLMEQYGMVSIDEDVAEAATIAGNPWADSLAEAATVAGEAGAGSLAMADTFAGEAGAGSLAMADQHLPSNNTCAQPPFQQSFEAEFNSAMQQIDNQKAALQTHDQQRAAAWDRFNTDLDDIQGLMKQAEVFNVTEQDSQDFVALCHSAYSKSLEEAGLQEDDKTNAMRISAETGEFQLQGGTVGNAWARLPKDNEFKIKSAQVFFT